jgi:hypothetical protein
LPGAAAARQRLIKAATPSEMAEILLQFQSSL